MNTESIGEKLRRERLKRNMSQEAVGEQLNMKVRTLGKIENDKVNPRESTLKKLTDFYDIDPDELT